MSGRSEYQIWGWGKLAYSISLLLMCCCCCCSPFASSGVKPNQDNCRDIVARRGIVALSLSNRAHPSLGLEEHFFNFSALLNNIHAVTSLRTISSSPSYHRFNAYRISHLHCETATWEVAPFFGGGLSSRFVGCIATVSSSQPQLYRVSLLGDVLCAVWRHVSRFGDGLGML